MAAINIEPQLTRDDTILKVNLLVGLLSVPAYMCVINKMSKQQIIITYLLFGLAIFGAMITTFIASNLRSRGLGRSAQDALWAGTLSFCGGILSIFFGQMIPKRTERIAVLVAMTGLFMGVILGIEFHWQKKNNQQPRRWVYVILWIVGVGCVSVSALFNDTVKHFRAGKNKVT